MSPKITYRRAFFQLGELPGYTYVMTIQHKINGEWVSKAHVQLGTKFLLLKNATVYVDSLESTIPQIFLTHPRLLIHFTDWEELGDYNKNLRKTMTLPYYSRGVFSSQKYKQIVIDGNLNFHAK